MGDTPPAPARTGAKEDRHFVTALARGLDVLKAFRSGEERLSNHDLAERCGLPKSTVTRLTYTLMKTGFLHRVPATGRYRLGLATLTLGGTTLSRLDVKEVSHPLLQKLADSTDSMASLALRDDLSMLYIENARGERAELSERVGVGSRLPMATTSIGRAWLAASSAETRAMIEERLAQINGREWKRLERGIRQGCADLEEFGCTRSFGDWHRDVNSIAVPLRLKGLPLMVLSLTAQDHQVSEARFMEELRPRLVETAREIEVQMDGDAG